MPTSRLQDPLRSTPFRALFLTQFLGALNDNLFKNALVVLAVFRSPAGGAGLAALAGGLFILPYLLLSSLSGQLADRFEKARLVRLTKLAELALMGLGAAALLSGSLTLLFVVLAGLGAQAALFSPLKYGLLPELLPPSALLRGNALVEAGTFAAILLGTIAGGLLIGLPHGPALVAAAGLGLALAGLPPAWRIPRLPPACPGLPIAANLLAGTSALLRSARLHPPIWRSALGLSWFWSVGATFLALFPVLAKTVFGADNRVVTLLLAMFVAGVGLGSVLAGRLGARRAAPAGVLLGLCTLGFAALVSLPGATGWTSPAAMAGSAGGLAALACLLGAAAAGGAFSVPLYAAIQAASAPGERARMIAANNVLNALGMVAGAAALAALSALGLGPAAILALAGALTLPLGLRLGLPIAKRPAPGP